MKKIFNFKKPLLCVLLCVCVLVGAFAVSGNSSSTETYTFDFEEKTSGSYNGSTGWSYDKPCLNMTPRIKRPIISHL